MAKSEILFKSQEGKSMKENLALLNRAKKLKERAKKLMKQESGDKNGKNINS